MTNNLTNKSDAELRALLQESRQTIAGLIDSLTSRPDMQNAIRILMRPDDMLENFSELAVKDPDLMRLVLHKLLRANHGCRNLESELTVLAHALGRKFYTK